MEARVGDMALKFDPIVVDVELAKKYLKDHGQDIKNKRIIPDYYEELDKQLSLPERYKILMEKIKENSKLICQLEYLENNVPLDVSEINIQLILKFLSLDCLTVENYIHHYMLSFRKDTPLAYFGLSEPHSCCVERLAVCHLYKKLSGESGLLRASTLYDSSVIRTTNIGIISERSNLESAVDAFLSSSSHISCFWRLHRIYVQESIYESFKELLDIKTTLKGTNGAENVEFKRLCSDLFVYEEKYVLIDYAGDVHAPQLKGKHVIFVEAYRTNEEVISLVGQLSLVGCVSLWSSDVAEANVLAYSIPASLVWINDYGNFEGPPEISTVLFSLVDLSVKVLLPSSFCNRYNIWSTYSKDKRLNIIRDVLKREASKLNSEDKKFKEVSVLLEKIDKVKFNSVDVADNKICVTLDCPVGIYYSILSCDIEVITHSLVLGNGVIAYDIETIIPFYDHLLLAGVPMVDKSYIFNNNESEKIQTKVYFHPYRRTKVVLTNFGTIFAN